MKTKLIIITLAAIGLIAVVHAYHLKPAVQLDAKAPWSHVGMVASEELDEISGLARSHVGKPDYWAHNDSGSGAELYAFSAKGQHMGKLTLKATNNRDWEDITSFHWQGKAWILVADVGDNDAKHPELQLHLIEEPDWQADITTQSREPTLSYRFVYPEGPRDSESIAVDAEEGSIYILTKRDKPARLYRIPLTLDYAGELLTAEYLGDADKIPPPPEWILKAQPVFGKWSSQPTAFDLAPDGRSAAVLTYRSVFVFPRAEGQSWAEALAGTPTEYVLPGLRQAESLVYADAQRILVSSEKRPSPLVVLNLAE
ncbi:MAG: hypothetical protein MI750_09495 [Xanthomonadales bacterium]|nr:hypothetical protein [Xanthomonadales bacterium]